MEAVEHMLLEKLKNLSRVKDYVSVLPTGTIMPKTYEFWREKLNDFEVRSDDVWVVTPPKSGTTWTQELVWCIIFGMDTERVKIPLSRRFPFFEYDTLIPHDRDVTQLAEEDFRRPGKTWECIKNLPLPRTIKSHFPYPLLPKQMITAKPKIIFVFRDPRDMCVSYYYHFIKLDGYEGGFDDFAELFVNDLILQLPYWKQVMGFWERRNDENILVLRYEEMKKDFASVTKRVASFLGKTLTDEEVGRLVEHCSFDVMKLNPAANNEFLTAIPPSEAAKGLKFMRKGLVGDWKNHITKVQQKAFHEWTMRNVAGTDFPYYQDYE